MKIMNQEAFEASLKKGQEVQLRWRGTSCHAIVDRVNKVSVAVKIKDALHEMPAGTRLVVNRVKSGRWAPSNCVRPADK